MDLMGVVDWMLQSRIHDDPNQVALSFLVIFFLRLTNVVFLSTRTLMENPVEGQGGDFISTLQQMGKESKHVHSTYAMEEGGELDWIVGVNKETSW